MQDATANLHNAMNDLQNVLRSVKNDTAVINDVHIKTTAAERNAFAVQLLQQKFDTHMQIMNDLTNAMQHLHNTTTDLQHRITNIEQLASTMSAFLSEVHEKTVVEPNR